MKTYSSILLLLLPFFLVGCAGNIHKAHHSYPTQEQMMTEMILPAPRVSNVMEVTPDTDFSKLGYGTGTSIVSRPLDEGYETFVITNAHVVAPMMKAELAAKINKARQGVTTLPEGFTIDLGETFDPIYLTYYRYEGVDIKEDQVIASVLSYDEIRDVALLRFESDYAYPVVNIRPGPIEYQVFQKIWSIGGAEGNNPFPTVGVISLVSEKNIALDGDPEFLMKKVLFTAPVSGGASGGPTFKYSQDCACFEWIAINQQIGVTMIPLVTPLIQLKYMAAHMAARLPINYIHWGIPVSEIRKVLKDTNFESLLDK